MQIEFVSVQSLPRISRWFSSAKSMNMQWNQSAGTREQAAQCSLRSKTQAVGCCPGRSLQHCSNLLLNCSHQSSTGAALTTLSPALPFPFCVLSSPVADCVTCTRWLKHSYEWERLFARGWMKWKTKTFICRVISSYVNRLPTLFLLSRVASSMNI